MKSISSHLSMSVIRDERGRGERKRRGSLLSEDSTAGRATQQEPLSKQCNAKQRASQSQSSHPCLLAQFSLTNITARARE
jgi:hypothetical protein